jgi:hypothetical protein
MRIPFSATRLLLLCLLCIPAAAFAQSGQPLVAVKPAGEIAADQSSRFKAECVSLLANWQTISVGTFSPDQMRARTRGLKGMQLQNLAQRSSHRGEHYQACVTYVFAAEVTYTSDRELPARTARSVFDAQQILGMAWIEQQMADGKPLTPGQQVEYGLATAQYKVVAKHWESVDNPVASTEPAAPPAASTN